MLRRRRQAASTTHRPELTTLAATPPTRLDQLNLDTSVSYYLDCDDRRATFRDLEFVQGAHGSQVVLEFVGSTPVLYDF